MASTVPSQNRVIDPFASYNSNAVNELTHIVTQGSNGLLTTNSLQVSLDSTSPLDTVVVSTGYIVKDDVLISITADHSVDFTDPDNYISTGVWLQIGYYYIVLEYTYVKSRPAPQASIKILKPGERTLLTAGSNYLLLKVVEVEMGALTFQIADIYDKDPSITSNARTYLKYYAGSTVDLPTFDQTRDQSRVAYESERNKFYFGYNDGWRELAAGGISTDLNTDTTGVVVGSLCYVDENRDAVPAIATARNTGADIVILSIGTAISGEGRGSVAGFVEEVPVEPGILIDIGDLLYLSDSTPGTVTNIRTAPVFQVVGRALSQGSVTTPIDMIFSPKLVLAVNDEGQIDSWIGPDGDSNYYKDIDVSHLDGTNAYICSWYDNSTHKEIVPVDVEVRSSGNIIRVYMNNNTTIVDYLIASGASIGGSYGGGGGGGVTDHALLSSLDYLSSGHTGFAPTTHYHPQYVDVPSGEILLFEKDTVVSGYTLLADQDDMIVYITKGSAAGGETGGTLKTGSTWTQPNHSHTVSASGTHSHNGPNHLHATVPHTLTIAEMPSHNHYIPYTVTTIDSIHVGNFTSNPGTYHITNPPTSYTGGGLPHSHGNTGAGGTGLTSSGGDHSHGGATGNDATVNTWRPTGRYYTRQRRI